MTLPGELKQDQMSRDRCCPESSYPCGGWGLLQVWGARGGESQASYSWKKPLLEHTAPPGL